MSAGVECLQQLAALGVTRLSVENVLPSDPGSARGPVSSGALEASSHQSRLLNLPTFPPRLFCVFRSLAPSPLRGAVQSLSCKRERALSKSQVRLGSRLSGSVCVGLVVVTPVVVGVGLCVVFVVGPALLSGVKLDSRGGASFAAIKVQRLDYCSIWSLTKRFVMMSAWLDVPLALMNSTAVRKACSCSQRAPTSR